MADEQAPADHAALGGDLQIDAPALSDLLVPWILLPCLLGELSLASWLAVKGVGAATSS